MRIFFDVDGVLIDGFHTKAERCNRWDKNMKEDLGIDPQAFSDFFIRGSFIDVQCGRLDLEEELEHWLKYNDYDVKAWQVINYWHERDSVLNAPVYAVVEQLSALPDIELYVATNQSHQRARYLYDVLGFKKHFRDIYYSARLGCLKENTDYFAKIEKELNFNPRIDPPLYFDDDPKNITVSSQRGWNVVLVDTADDIVNHPAIRALLAA